MTNSKPKQLNTFEIKSEISRLLKALEKSTIIIDTREFKTLDEQENKQNIIKLLFKEFNLCNENSLPVVKNLLLRYCDEKTLLNELENIIKNPKNDNNIKLHSIELISTFKSDWHEQEYDKYLIYDDELVQKETKELLDEAIINPEIQLDFLDFFSAIPPKDQKMLIESLQEDQHVGDLANILIPIFLSFPSTEIGAIAINLLGLTKSKYAYKELLQSYDLFDKNLKPTIKLCLNKLKLSGANLQTQPTQDYRNCKFYMIPPDGEGNISLIYEEKNTQNDTTRLIGIVFDDYTGIRDCLGFNAISEFEATFLIDKLTGSDFKTEITPAIFKMLLLEAEKLNYKKSAPPYEYNCWKRIFIDIEPENINIKEFLSQHFDSNPIDEKEIHNILNSDFTIPWFYTHNFGDETEQFFKELDLLLKKQSIEDIKINEFIEANIDKIFYKEEKENWKIRLYLTAYGKFVSNDKECAEALYKITQTENSMHILYEFIVKQSIFQYFLKMISEKYYLKYKQQDIEEILSYLEKIWGFYV